MRWKLYLATILLIFMLVFVVQNTQTVNFDFFFWSFGLPRALMLLVVFLAGIATGLLYIAGRNHRRLADSVKRDPNQK